LMRLMKSKVYILFFSLVLSGCFASRSSTEDVDSPVQNDVVSLCEKIEPFQSIYIDKIKASIDLDGENYDAKISLFYIPDSIIFLSAVNTGFEIVRAAITPDSSIIINRIDKLVYIYKDDPLGYKPPVEFEELEYLLNKMKVCEGFNKYTADFDKGRIDFSVQDIKKSISFDANSLEISKFEFFHKKTGEYIVGEFVNSDTLSILSNYMMENVEIVAIGGTVTHDKVLNINLSFNKNKYTILNY